MLQVSIDHLGCDRGASDGIQDSPALSFRICLYSCSACDGSEAAIALAFSSGVDMVRSITYDMLD